MTYRLIRQIFNMLTICLIRLSVIDLAIGGRSPLPPAFKMPDPRHEPSARSIVRRSPAVMIAVLCCACADRAISSNQPVRVRASNECWLCVAPPLAWSPTVRMMEAQSAVRLHTAIEAGSPSMAYPP